MNSLKKYFTYLLYVLKNIKLTIEYIQNMIILLGDMSNLDSKVDTTKVRVEELKDKWGSSELKIEKLKRGHQEIKGNPITSLYYQN